MPRSPQSITANGRLLYRSLFPSGASLMTSCVLALVVVGGHLLLITLQGKAVPVFLDTHALQAYTTTIVDPLLEITRNVTVNNGLGVVLWAVFGWTLYAIVAFVVNLTNDLRSARQQVRYNNGQVIPTPMHRSVLLRLMWRLLVSMLFMVFTILASKAMHYVFVQDYQILAVVRMSDAIQLFLTNLIIWVALLHGYVILLRWYVLRTRILGEIIY